MNPLACLLLLPGLVLAELDTTFLQLAPPPASTDAASAPRIRDEALASQARFCAGKTGDRYFQAPGILADREAELVQVWCQATGMESGAQVEFFVIAENSGHDYEAPFMAFAKPGDLHRALEFIGLKAGAPVDPRRQRFWPVGSRALASVQVRLPGADAVERLDIEAFVITSRNGEVMPRTPWVFVGSEFLPDEENPTNRVYAADVYSPNSIAANFNLVNTVFDLPAQGSKSATYGTYLRNPALPLQVGHPVILELRPAGAAAPSIGQATLRVSPGGKFRWWGDVKGSEVEGHAEAESALWTLLGMLELQELHLTLDLEAELTLDEAVAFASALKEQEQKKGLVRVAPPTAGQVYYQAFLPSPEYRERAKRPSQPWELHLRDAGDGSSHVSLIELEEVWGEGIYPTVVEHPTPLKTVEEWVGVVQQREHPGVLFLYAPGNRTLGELRRWLSPVLPSFPVVYVFREP